MVLEKTLESPLDCKEIQPVHPKGDQSWVFIRRTDVEAETPILWPPDEKSWLIGKDPNAGKDWGQEKGMTEAEMVGWHHQLNGHGFGWTPGVGDGQGGLACCGSWGHKESDTTEWLNWLNWNRNELLSHAKTSRKLKCTLLSGKSIWKAYRVHNSNYMTSWKWQNQGDSKKICDCRGVEGWTGTTQKTFRARTPCIWHYTGEYISYILSHQI